MKVSMRKYNVIYRWTKYYQTEIEAPSEAAAIEKALQQGINLDIDKYGEYSVDSFGTEVQDLGGNILYEEY